VVPQVSNQALAELKEKIKILNNEIEILRNECKVRSVPRSWLECVVINARRNPSRSLWPLLVSIDAPGSLESKND
jgi:hypothetical protein